MNAADRQRERERMLRVVPFAREFCRAVSAYKGDGRTPSLNERMAFASLLLACREAEANGTRGEGR